MGSILSGSQLSSTKKYAQPKLKVPFYLMDEREDLSPGTASQVMLRKLRGGEKARGELGYIGVLQQREGSDWRRERDRGWGLLLIRENQISQVKEFSTFVCLGRCKGLGSLKSFL